MNTNPGAKFGVSITFGLVVRWRGILSPIPLRKMRWSNKLSKTGLAFEECDFGTIEDSTLEHTVLKIVLCNRSALNFVLIFEVSSKFSLF